MFFLVSQNEGTLLHHQGEGRLGWLVLRKTCITVAFMYVNLEDKGALAKLEEAISTNDYDR